MIRKILITILLGTSPFLVNKSEGQALTSIQDLLIERLSGYCKAIPWEDVYVHTDRREYIAGEELWLKTYVADRMKGIPSSGNKIVYIEILSPSNQPVVQKRIMAINGSGPGCIIIPDTLTTGKYILRAYTGLMKNFLPEYCFIKELNIFNPLKDKVLKERSLQPGRSSVNPPGGNTVSSLVNLRIDNSGTESVLLTIETGTSFRSVNKNLCYLLILSRGTVRLSEQVRLTSDITETVIQRKDIASGVNHITLFDASGKPVAERLFFSAVAEQQNVTVNAPEFAGIREKITVGIELPVIPAGPENMANLSISVSPMSETGEQDISDFMVFGTEFGVLPAKFRHSSLSLIPVSFIDSCLMNQGSGWINWDKILIQEEPMLTFSPEAGEHFVSGHLVNNKTDKADTSAFVILSVPGKVARFQYAVTDANGRFTFKIPLGETLQDLIMQPLAANRNSLIRIESAFPELYPKTGTLQKPADKTNPAYLGKMSSNYQVGRIYGTINYSFPPVPAPVQSLRKRFYGKPDIELVMDDYIKLPVMSEVFFELLPGVFLKNRRSVWEITIADPEANRIYDEPPVLLVDGVVIDDAAKIANLDPELVEKIDVVKERYLIGDFIFFGLVNVITRTGDLSNVTLPEYATRLQYRVTEPVVTFAAPVYLTPEMRQRRIPDFRNTMYWNPSVIPGKEGKTTVEFWSSDYQGQYVIDIQGITSDGKKVTLKKALTIR